MVIAVLHDQKPFTRKSPSNLSTQIVIIDAGHCEPPQIFAHLRIRAWATSRHVDLRHVREVVGAVGGHRKDHSEERLAGLLQMPRYFIQRIAEIKTVALVVALGALVFGIEYLFHADR